MKHSMQAHTAAFHSTLQYETVKWIYFVVKLQFWTGKINSSMSSGKSLCRISLCSIKKLQMWIFIIKINMNENFPERWINGYLTIWRNQIHCSFVTLLCCKCFSLFSQLLWKLILVFLFIFMLVWLYCGLFLLDNSCIFSVKSVKSVK